MNTLASGGPSQYRRNRQRLAQPWDGTTTLWPATGPNGGTTTMTPKMLRADGNVGRQPDYLPDYLPQVKNVTVLFSRHTQRLVHLIDPGWRRITEGFVEKMPESIAPVGTTTIYLIAFVVPFSSSFKLFMDIEPVEGAYVFGGHSWSVRQDMHRSDRHAGNPGRTNP